MSRFKLRNKSFKFIDKYFGTEKYILKSFFFLTLFIYYVIASNSIKFNFSRLNNVYSGDMFAISGILLGLLTAYFGMITSSKNYMLDRLNENNNIRILYRLNLKTIFCFVINLIIYVFKSFFIIKSNNNVNIVDINSNILILISHIGIFYFIYGLILLLLSLYFLKKIFLPKEN